MPKTNAEQQIEALKRMKEGPVRSPSPVVDGADAQPPRPRAKVGPALPLGRETWRKLQERQRSTREFRSKQEMGEWAAQLLLALPSGAHRLDADEREALLRRLRECCADRGPR